MLLQRLCLVAALASTISVTLAGCNGGGDTGIPVTPGMPDSGMPDSSMPDSSMPNSSMPNSGMPNSAGGLDMPEPTESAGPPPPIEAPFAAPPPATPAPQPSSIAAIVPAPSVSPTANGTNNVFRPSVKRTAHTVTVIVHLNEKKIPPGSYLWFASTTQLHGARTAAFRMQSSQITLAGRTYTGPTGVVNVTPAAKTATVKSTSNDSIVSTLPPAISGNVFANGLIVYLPAGLPARQSATWSAHFQSSSQSTNGLKVQWQVSAVAYSRFSASYGALRIDSTGTPQKFLKNVIPGTRATGSSQPVTVCPCPAGGT